MITQMKIVKDAETDVNKVDTNNDSKRSNNRDNRRRRRGQGQNKQCDKCGYQHSENPEACPAFGKDCRRSGAKNHFAAKCKQEIKFLAETETREPETYQTEEVSTVKLDDAQLVTLRLESGKSIRFQPDTGAQCNVLPLHVYKQATHDGNLEKVKPVQTSLVAYGGSRIKVIGHTDIKVYRGEVSYVLNCRLVDNKEIHPILGRKACLGMNIIQYNDNDLLNKPLASAPKRLQRMLLHLQQYRLTVKYKKGKDLHLADTLSRAYLPEVNACDLIREFEEVDHRPWLPVSEETWRKLKNAAADDPVQQKLRSVVLTGWPVSRTDVPECACLL